MEHVRRLGAVGSNGMRQVVQWQEEVTPCVAENSNASSSRIFSSRASYSCFAVSSICSLPCRRVSSVGYSIKDILDKVLGELILCKQALEYGRLKTIE
jgi:hypothetical protein